MESILRSRRTVAALVGILVTVASVAAWAPVRAHDHAVPKTVLRSLGKRMQLGTIVSFCWVAKSEDGGVVLCADGLFSWPKAARVAAGRRMRIRIRKRQIPDSLALSAWAKVTPNDIPVGAPKDVDFIMRPFRKDGKTVARDIVFTPDEPGRHYYLAASGRWPDVNDPTLMQEALWIFHVRTRREAQ